MFATFAVTILLAAAPVAGHQPEAVQQHDQRSTAPCTLCPMHSAHRAGVAQTRIDDPHSTVVESDGYAVANDGAVAEYGATNELINAAEAGNPNSVDYANRSTARTDNAGWQALEAESPHNAQAGRRVAAASSPSTATCNCLVSDARTGAGRR